MGQGLLKAKNTKGKQFLKFFGKIKRRN